MEERMEPGFFSVEPRKVRQLLLVTPDLLPQVWPQVEHLFRENASLWSGYYTLDSFPALFREEVLQLWVMNDEDEFLLVLVTELRVFPRTTVVNLLFILGSDLKDGMLFLDYIEDWACGQGARKSVIVGRKGFLRLLKSSGYRQEAIVLVKNISGRVEH